MIFASFEKTRKYSRYLFTRKSGFFPDGFLKRKRENKVLFLSQSSCFLHHPTLQITHLDLYTGKSSFTLAFLISAYSHSLILYRKTLSLWRQSLFLFSGCGGVQVATWGCRGTDKDLGHVQVEKGVVRLMPPPSCYPSLSTAKGTIVQSQ